jgi:hypothetical protein
MVRTLIKKGKDLSIEEIKELERIYCLNNPFMPEDHIKKNHIDKTNPIFYLYKIDGKIVAFQAFTLFYKKTPFTKKTIPVLYVNLGYKDEKADQHIKNFAKKSSATFLKENLGFFWFLKRFVLVFQTYNPKIVARSSRFFSVIYPNTKDESPPQNVHEFAQNFFKNELKSPNTIINKNLVKEETYDKLSPISDSWDRLYKSPEAAMNNLFIKHDVIKEKEEAFHLTGKAFFVIGYNNILGVIKQKARSVR